MKQEWKQLGCHTFFVPYWYLKNAVRHEMNVSGSTLFEEEGSDWLVAMLRKNQLCNYPTAKGSNPMICNVYRHIYFQQF